MARHEPAQAPAHGGRDAADMRRANLRRRLRQRLAAESFRDARAEHERFQERVRGEPVCAMSAGGRHLAAHRKPGQRRPPAIVGGDAAHVVMRGGRHRNSFTHGIDARCGAGGVDGWESVGKARPYRLAAVEINARAAAELAVNGARHDVARRKLGHGMTAQHEAFAPAVDEDRALAAQGFGGERRGVAADGDGGGMELHEFGVGDERARACGHGKPVALRRGGIGGHGVKRAHASGRQHHMARADENERARLALVPAMGLGEDAAHAPLMECQRARTMAREHADRGRGRHRAAERGDDRFARAIAAHAHDARAAVGAFAAEHEMARGVAVEGHAEAGEIVDARRGFLGEETRHVRVDDAGAHRDGVGGVLARAVAGTDGRGNAALRPSARGAVAGAAAVLGEQGDLARSKLEGGEEACEPRADDENVAGIDHVVSGHGAPLA